MKYYSELTKKLYDSEKALIDAENEVKVEQIKKEQAEAAAKKQRAEDAKVVEEAFEKMKAARKEYQEAIANFCKKHGAYHKTLTEKDLPEADFSLLNLFDVFKDLF